ncbi:Aste57867_19665 [Aphanomyces stellatus]|uniref:Aste57867_19665 protein n=1 Tax=Aphanomyces stellatus TaxID=120398 RepID=A0A485KIB6_9STRA|nr:hypothetical protein As57867_019600 [Aphanomyces stellatus]KAF0704080.1 hypothetical protein As57867_007413 [Aphanomyces stellatus]VFT84351.1 Aste57867_7439 [Aphanomyces stellatus]VFT96365.1 Aste57867_19665 [Aphanomyces stellatus]
MPPVISKFDEASKYRQELYRHAKMLRLAVTWKMTTSAMEKLIKTRRAKVQKQALDESKPVLKNGLNYSQVQGLRSLGINVEVKRQRLSVKTHSDVSNRLVWTSFLTPQRLRSLSMIHNIPLETLKAAVSSKDRSGENNTVKTNYVDDKSRKQWEYRNWTEARFLADAERHLRERKTTFKVNIARGFRYFNVRTQESTIYEANIANTAIFELPFVINRRTDINAFFQAVNANGLSTTPLLGASSDKFEAIVEYHLVIYDTGSPIGNMAAAMPDIIKNDVNIMNPRIQYEKCIFACIAYDGLYKANEKVKIRPEELSMPAKDMFKTWCAFNKKEYSFKLYKETQGLDLMQFDALEECFGVGIECYRLDEESAKYIRFRETTKLHGNVISLVIHDGHAMYVRSPSKLLAVYECKKCRMLFNTRIQRNDHQKNNCDELSLVTYVKKPTVYKPNDNTILKLQVKYGTSEEKCESYVGSDDDEPGCPFIGGLSVKGEKDDNVKDDHYHDHFMTYDLEVIQKPRVVEETVVGMPEKKSNTIIINDHVPVSVSIYNTLTDETIHLENEDPKQLIDDMVNEFTKGSKEIWKYNAKKWKGLVYAMGHKNKDMRNASKPKYDAYISDLKALDKAFHSVPIIGFNSGSYDMNTIKSYIFTSLLNRMASGVKKPIKNGNKYMCVATSAFKLMDITTYLGAGTSYEKFLKAYGVVCTCGDFQTCTCGMGKGFFPFEYVTSYDVLNQTELPPQNAFNSKLKKTTMSDFEYARVQFVWMYYRMKTLKDLLRWYNDCDVKPLAEAIKIQRKFYKKYELDMFQDGVSLPGLAEKIMYKKAFKDLPMMGGVRHGFELTEEDNKKFQSSQKLTVTLDTMNENLAAQEFKCFTCECRLSKRRLRVMLKRNTELERDDSYVSFICKSCDRESVKCDDVFEGLKRMKKTKSIKFEIGNSDDLTLFKQGHKCFTCRCALSLGMSTAVNGYNARFEDDENGKFLICLACTFDMDDLLGKDIDNEDKQRRVLYQMTYGKEFKFPMKRFEGYKAQDLKASRKCTVTHSKVQQIMSNQSYKRYLCNFFLTKDTASVDRINNSIGHSNDNIKIACISCNVARKDMSPHAFKKMKFEQFHRNRLVHSIDEAQKEVYEMMKANTSIAGGPAIIYKRFAEAMKTYIRAINWQGNADEKAKLCKKIIGFDANALYLWALSGVMPCGRLTKEETYEGIVDDFANDKVFGFLQCDIPVPDHLKERFSEMAPIFKNVEIDPTEEIIGKHMFDYNQSRGIKRRRRLVS